MKVEERGRVDLDDGGHDVCAPLERSARSETAEAEGDCRFIDGWAARWRVGVLILDRVAGCDLRTYLRFVPEVAGAAGLAGVVETAEPDRADNELSLTEPSAVCDVGRGRS